MRNFNEAVQAVAVMNTNIKMEASKLEQLRWSLPSGTSVDPDAGFYHTQISNSPGLTEKV